jgi:UDP-glucose 4-epimerase
VSRVLVTGGSGFIGSHVVDRLLAHGLEPRILDLEPSHHHRNGSVEVHLGSINDHDACVRAMTGCDTVVHLAAVADVDKLDADPGGAEEINTRGTLTVLRAAAEAGVKRVVYASSIWVYSDCPEATVDENSSIAAPQHFYTATKLAGELYCRAYAERAGVEWTILRFGIPYGPRARPTTVIAALTNKAVAGDPLTIAGDGLQTRRFVYVEDLAEGVVLSVRHGSAGRVYNLAGAQDVTILEVAEAVRDAVGDVRIVHVEGRRADFGGKEVLSRRAHEELGWAAATPLHEGVRRYVEWRRASGSANGASSNGSGAHVEAAERRFLVMTAGIGAGHDLPAEAVADELVAECENARVDVEDGLAAMGSFWQRLGRDGSWTLFRHAPWVFGIQYFFLSLFAPTRWLAGRVMYWITGGRLLRLIEERDPEAVISTYPGTTAILGELRRRGRLKVPLYASITDLAGLQFWAHPGVDMHFVIHEESIAEVERIAGSDSARWARPPSSPEFLRPRGRAEAREALDLPRDGKLVLVSGGGWGVGRLDRAVRTALELEGVTVVCLTGHNDELRAHMEKRFADDERVRVSGFTDRMSDHLAAADVLVHSTAGLTVLEAQIRGCHVISYGFAVGHVRRNDIAYRRFGLADTPRSRRALRAVLARCLRTERPPDPGFAALPTTASFVAAHARKPRFALVPALRVRVMRAAAVGGPAAVMASLWTLHHF